MNDKERFTKMVSHFIAVEFRRW